MIYGDRIRLRAPEREDLPRFVAWLNDPQVRTGLMIDLPLSQVMEEGWFENMLKQPVEEHPMVIELLQDDSWIPLGNCAFHEINWRYRSAQVGLFIGEKSYWDKGIGTEVMCLLLKHGFETLNLNRIGLMVFENNHRAIRAYEKAGFIHEGRTRQGHYQEGEYLDIIHMSILRAEWDGNG